MRNLDKQVKQGQELIRNHMQADISLEEINAFYDQLVAKSQGQDLFTAFHSVISDVFYMGVSVGQRNS